MPQLSNKEIDELLKTVFFTEGMEDAYSNSEYFNRALKSVESHDLSTSPKKVGAFIIFRREWLASKKISNVQAHVS